MVQNDSIREPLGFKPTIVHDGCKLSHNPVDKLSIDYFLLECDIAQALILRGRRTGFVHNSTMPIDAAYKCVGNFHGVINWFMMSSKDFTSNINFKIKTEIGELVSFNGKSITFRLSSKEV